MRIALGLIVVAACGDPNTNTSADAGLTPDAMEETPPIPPTVRDELDKLSPLPGVPADPTNAFADNAAAARLGQMLFFDKSYSGAIAAAAADTGTNGGV